MCACVCLWKLCNRHVVNKAWVYDTAYIIVSLHLHCRLSLCFSLSHSHSPSLLYVCRSDQRKTKVKKKTSDPHFDETIYFEVNRHAVFVILLHNTNILLPFIHPPAILRLRLIMNFFFFLFLCFCDQSNPEHKVCYSCRLSTRNGFCEVCWKLV